MKNAGHSTFFILSIFLNLSYTKYYATEPAICFTTSLIQVYGHIKIKEPIHYILIIKKIPAYLVAAK